MDSKQLQELRAKHRLCRCKSSLHMEAEHCRQTGDSWPCIDSQILDMALESERLRADLERLAVETMGITAAGAKAYGEAERLRAALEKVRRLAETRGDHHYRAIAEVGLGLAEPGNTIRALAGTEAHDA